VPKVLVDTGPLVAWLDQGDGDHRRVKQFMADFDGVLVTTWPVLTEVCHLLPEHIVGRFMRWFAFGGAEVFELPAEAIEEIAATMEQYEDLPMDLADASLVWSAAALRIKEILTLDDKDFGIYRLPGGKPLENLLRGR
jgi:predicted nucleic acid-binding protein